MKLDKETVVKHQFWFLLGGYVLVWLIAVLWLKLAVPDEINKARETYKKSADDLANSSRDPKNPATFCPPWEQDAKLFDEHKQVIWKEAWDYQRNMFDWPFTEKVSFLKRELIPQDELTPEEREEFKRTLYDREYDELKKLAVGDKNAPGFLTPIELEGGFDTIMKPLKWTETPTREECWLAQEDFWVRRELLYDLAAAVVAQAYMYPVLIDASKEPQPADVAARLRFRNQNWEITLLIKKGNKNNLVISRDSTIKNIHPSGRTQPLASGKGEGIVFNVQQDRAFNRFELKGEPVPWTESIPFGSDYWLKDINWKSTDTPVAMSQAFDWYTSPIRRIKALEILQQSCRTFTTALKANDTLAKLDPRDTPAADPNAQKTDTTGSMAGGDSMMAGRGAMMAKMMSGGLAGGAANVTPTNATPSNGLNRDRYLQAPKEGDAPEKPCRHLPLGIQLIVDQADMQDVLLALANSRLRIQITQVDFHRVQDIQPLSEDEKKGGGVSDLRTGPMLPGMMGMGGMMASKYGRGGPPRMQGATAGGGGGSSAFAAGRRGGMMPSGGMMMEMMRRGGGMMGKGGTPQIVGPMGAMMAGRGGPVPPGTTTTGTQQTAAPQQEENLVEMTVYGIATLYRRPDPPQGDQAGQTGQSTTTAPTGASR